MIFRLRKKRFVSFFFGRASKRLIKTLQFIVGKDFGKDFGKDIGMSIRLSGSGSQHSRNRRGAKEWSLVAFFWLAIGLATGCGSARDTVSGQIHLDDGTIQGRQFEGGLHAYMGIPYAAPPTNDRRWKPPAAVMPWSGVRDATSPGPACMQPSSLASFYDENITHQNEDCLTLNVWTRASAADDRLPVMVWIHGGGLVTGSGDLYPGFELTKEGVVLVTINYRLGPFGFFAHPELTAEGGGHSGNQGYLDQLAALTWVQANIERFGGDPGNVTVFGESAGSWSVSVLQASPMAEGLMHKAIGQSGARLYTMAALAVSENGQPSAHDRGEYAASVLAAAETPDLAALRALPAETVIERFAGSPQLMLDMEASTVVDGRVLPKQPREIYAQGEQLDIPVMLGSNADEMTTLLDVFLAGGEDIPTAELLKAQINLLGEQANSLLTLYADIEADPFDRAPVEAFLTDMMFTQPMRLWAEAMANVSSAAYLYWWSYPTRLEGAEDLGAFHASEIPYVFGQVRDFAGIPIIETDQERRLAVTAGKLWTSFAKTGKPSAPGVPDWPPFELSSKQMLEIGAELKIVSDVRGARVSALTRATGGSLTAPSP